MFPNEVKDWLRLKQNQDGKIFVSTPFDKEYRAYKLMRLDLELSMFAFSTYFNSLQEFNSLNPQNHSKEQSLLLHSLSIAGVLAYYKCFAEGKTRGVSLVSSVVYKKQDTLSLFHNKILGVSFL